MNSNIRSIIKDDAAIRGGSVTIKQRLERESEKLGANKVSAPGALTLLADNAIDLSGFECDPLPELVIDLPEIVIDFDLEAFV